MLMDNLAPVDKVRVAAGESMKKAIKNHKTRQKQERMTRAQKEAERGYRVIKFWFEKVEIPSCFEEQMILEILGHERGAAPIRNLDWPDHNIALDVVLEKTKPAQISTCSNIDVLNAWTYWLCGFARLAIPKWETREAAFMLALSNAGGIAYKPVLH
jgi:hypothetical protein